jgi:hypothetical protein
VTGGLRGVTLGVVLPVALLAGACGGRRSPTAPSGTAVDVTGTWSGSATDSSGPGTMRWEVSQSDLAFRGSLILTDTATGVTGRGAVSGTSTSTGLTFSAEVAPGGFGSPYGSCSANVAGQGTVSGSSITGTYSGTNSCSGIISAGQFTLNRQ